MHTRELLLAVVCLALPALQCEATSISRETQGSLQQSVQVLLEESVTLMHRQQRLQTVDVPRSLRKFVDHDKGPMQLLIEQEDPKNSLFTDINFFDPAVFDARYYQQHNAGVRKALGNDNRLVSLRRHWIEYGIREGLRASPNFDAHVYLQKNRDIAHHFGALNFPMAIAHYLRRGVHEKYRETGGPSRINLYDPRVFDWKWYMDNNPDVKARGVKDETTAKEHWAKVGLQAGYQASPNIKLSAYLVGNRDLLDAYGSTNYRAALSHWLYRGFNETWRPNGGSTCKFWGTWCQDDLLQHVQRTSPSFPKYNSAGGLADPPVPHRGGWSVEINGRMCSDRRSQVELMATSSRVAEVTHMVFVGKNELRECDVKVRHYIDIQTHVEDKSPKELSLVNWVWDNTMDPELRKQPIDSPKGFFYAGYQYAVVPEGSNENKFGTFGDNYNSRRNVEFDISKTRLQDDKRQAGAVTQLSLKKVFEIHHIYKIDPDGPVYSADLRTPSGSTGITNDMEWTDQTGVNVPDPTPIPGKK